MPLEKDAGLYDTTIKITDRHETHPLSTTYYLKIEVLSLPPNKSEP